MGRGGRKRQADGPERRCIATGESLPASELIRFAVSPEGAVVPDLLGRLPGRGMWVRADRAAIERAVARGAFSRAAKAKVTVPADLPDRVAALQAARVVQLLSLARKGGQAVAGFDKVRAALAEGRAVALVQALDGSPDQKRKLRPPGDEAARIECLTADELGQAFGREKVIHAALLAGGLAERVVEEAAKLRRLRAIPARQE